MRTAKTRIHRTPIVPNRVRSIGRGGFSFFPNRFVQEGFFAVLSTDELLLYVLLVLVGDRLGISFYCQRSLCDLLQMPLERYLQARNALIAKDLIAFDGQRFQVLALPSNLPPPPQPLRTDDDFERDDPATIKRLLRAELGGDGGGFR